jgi:2',3'-cyclic-nucleotide 2'-phosphodiesterase (5'-nucleotidase family)
MPTTPRAVPRSVLLLASILVLLAGVMWGTAPAGAAREKPKKALFSLTLLHNNDGESQLIDAGEGLEDFGGVARFATVVKNLKKAAQRGPDGKTKRGVLMVSSGDNFLAGPEFSVSLEKGVPFYDTIALDLIGYDASALGNHEFDFGPDVLADFIIGFRRAPFFVSANLDFSKEPRLQALVDDGIIVASTVIRERGERIGLVGATTPALRFISSPRDVEVDPDVVGTVQAQVDLLESRGINKIIMISHLQSIQEDLALAPMLSGIDIMVAGGGDELLANEDDLLIPGDEDDVFGPYPLTAMDADGDTVYVVTTSGSYKYVGRLIVGFDRSGDVVRVDDRSGPVRVSGVPPDAVRPDRKVQRQVVDPVQAALDALDRNIVATSEVDLDGRRSQVRTVETNEGNLIADSLFWQATELAPEFGAPLPEIALQNGGGIRSDTIIPAGDISELDTFDMVPFPNFVSIVESIPPQQFKEIMENAVSRVEFGDGRFAQISGFRFTWDALGIPQELDEDGNVEVPGTRIRELVLDDGTVIVEGGEVDPDAPAVDVATIDFLARGGDQYPFRGAPFTTLGVTYQQALVNYLQAPEADGGLGGVIRAADYPEGGEGRITRLN